MALADRASSSGGELSTTFRERSFDHDRNFVQNRDPRSKLAFASAAPLRQRAVKYGAHVAYSSGTSPRAESTRNGRDGSTAVAGLLIR